MITIEFVLSCASIAASCQCRMQCFVRDQAAIMLAFSFWLLDLQMLGYTVELKLESSIPLSEKMQKVEAVIQQLNLDGCRDVIIGNAEQRGISGICL